MEKLKNKVIRLSKNRVIDYILIIIIGCIISIPLSKIQLAIGTHDGIVHFIRLKGVVSAINIQEFPPLIAPDVCMSSGYAMMLFYNPIVTFVPIFIFVLIKEYFLSMKIFAVICILISGITMYHFTYQITNKRTIALISAALYMNVPYLLGNIYVRYAMGEFTALAFMPLTFIGIYSLINQDGKKHYFISIGAILVILSHTITSVYLAGLCFLYLILNIKKLKNTKVIKRLIVNIVFIIIITMFFWLPIFEANNLSEYGIFDNRVMGTNSEFVASRAIDMKDIIFGDDSRLTPIIFIGIPTIILGILTIFVFRKVNIEYKKTYLIFVFFSLLLLFMTTKYFPWENMPDTLCKLQFPWRLLGFFAFFSSIICAINISIVLDKITSKILIKLVISVILLMLIIINSLYVINTNIVKNTEGYKDYDLYSYFYNQELFLNILNTEYLPKKILIKEDKIEYIKGRAESNSIVLNGEAEILDEYKENLTLTLTILNARKDTKIEFPFIYYPGYEITLNENDKVKKIKSIESENGYVAVQLNEETQNANIKVEYKGTLLMKISYIVSLIGLLGYIIYIYLENHNIKQNTTQNSENVLK